MSERNINTIDLDTLSTLEIIRKINEEDEKIAKAIKEEEENIATAINIIVKTLKEGGKMFYIGSGTSGKLGVIDASDCPPTFGVEDSLVQGIISGGDAAVSGWLEHTEDDKELAIEDLKARKITNKDVLIGITASGNTPYVNSAIKYANELGCRTIGIMCSKSGSIRNICDLTIAVDVGAEVIMGSTRMKAGTAQKMILNMLSTTAMIKLGKTYSNLMVNVKPINDKLKERVKEIVMLATGKNLAVVEKILMECNYDPKTAIVMIKTGISVKEAHEKLKLHNGRVYDALKG
ncbi:N-acetylmuramic acid 6-phosphate etherase [Clostridium sp. MB40-C1]|uniref:N-acetylmuramic acid 6-phosphate etherase n=1 Tax=Clostridium sp. MB40-C1 TaxID=3070996 RepID=UPI0027E0E61A|nr:N-acetylmuramic acid 6-phosphate etherase [Clostridium sp. MB40-C1]WMJ81777.1 N-acetylmuramic acid 6-phosphate etherase [Clostridium sp. MB40-C1]